MNPSPGSVTYWCGWSSHFQGNANYLLRSAGIDLEHNLYRLGKKTNLMAFFSFDSV